MKPFFSVIIPLYNKEKYIKNTLKCVLDQSFKNFEIIVVNDGSTDKSLEIINSFSDNRLVIINQENKGVSVARNVGMARTKSDFICFLDADDTWKKNHLQIFYETILKFPKAKMYCSRYVTQISKKKFIENYFIDITSDYEGYIDDFFKSSLINRIATASSVCINKDVYYKIGTFSKKISNGEDIDYWIRVALNFKTAITKKITLIYNYLPENKSLSKSFIHNTEIFDFNQYEEHEINNKSLKKFLDLYRIEYALKYHIYGNNEKAIELIKQVNKENLKLKTKLLFNIPGVVLRQLLKLKHFLKSKGFDFTVYH